MIVSRWSTKYLDILYCWSVKVIVNRVENCTTGECCHSLEAARRAAAEHTVSRYVSAKSVKGKA